MMGSIAYQRLDKAKEQFRLLTILDHDVAMHGHEDQQEEDSAAEVSHVSIKCHLWHFSMRDVKKESVANSPDIDWSGKEQRARVRAHKPLGYVALSYVWGDKRDTTPIEVNGRQTFVTRNLGGALRVLREKQLLTQGYGVWVDALCIDQSNMTERNEEVGRMRDIYKNASAIVMWVGEEEGDGEQAIQLIRMVSSAMKSTTTDQIAKQMCGEHATLGPLHWAALARFMDRPYWSRLWILQEVAMGDRSTPILCGRHAVTWGDLYDVVYVFASRHLDLVFSGVDREHPVHNGLRRNHIIQLNSQQVAQKRDKEAHALPILDIARRCSVSDSRDRIYGILGMLPRRVARMVVPDYSQDPARIYWIFAKTMISACPLVASVRRIQRLRMTDS
jgi:hypothetical protein